MSSKWKSAFNTLQGQHAVTRLSCASQSPPREPGITWSMAGLREMIAGCVLPATDQLGGPARRLGRAPRSFRRRQTAPCISTGQPAYLSRVNWWPVAITWPSRHNPDYADGPATPPIPAAHHVGGDASTVTLQPETRCVRAAARRQPCRTGTAVRAPRARKDVPRGAVPRPRPTRPASTDRPGASTATGSVSAIRAVRGAARQRRRCGSPQGASLAGQSGNLSPPGGLASRSQPQLSLIYRV